MISVGVHGCWLAEGSYLALLHLNRDPVPASSTSSLILLVTWQKVIWTLDTREQSKRILRKLLMKIKKVLWLMVCHCSASEDV
jgi:hypothetical protein